MIDDKYISLSAPRYLDATNDVAFKKYSNTEEVNPKGLEEAILEITNLKDTGLENYLVYRVS